MTHYICWRCTWRSLKLRRRNYNRCGCSLAVSGCRLKSHIASGPIESNARACVLNLSRNVTNEITGRLRRPLFMRASIRFLFFLFLEYISRHKRMFRGSSNLLNKYLPLESLSLCVGVRGTQRHDFSSKWNSEGEGLGVFQGNKFIKFLKRCHVPLKNSKAMKDFKVQFFFNLRPLNLTFEDRQRRGPFIVPCVSLFSVHAFINIFHQRTSKI